MLQGCGNSNPVTAGIGKWSHAYTMEQQLEAPQKTKIKLPYDPAAASWCIFRN